MYGGNINISKRFRSLLKKYPIITVHGCKNACFNKIRGQKRLKPVESHGNLMNGLEPSDVSRVDEEGECLGSLKKEKGKRKKD